VAGFQTKGEKVKHGEATDQEAKAHRFSFALRDLPLKAQGRWNSHFVSTYLAYVGSLDNPWDITGEDLVGQMMNIWKSAFPGIETSFANPGPVHNLVSVSMCSSAWLNTIPSSTIGTASGL
jgi:hypothetical protein